MFTFLLVIIYLSFISLGLPDSLLGSAWPAMYKDLAVSLSTQGVLSMLISGGTIISSLFSGKLIKRFGTGKLTFISVAMTAVALLGFSISPSFIWLCVMAIPLGLGAGSVDAALNNFVALHYKAKHMSWLHCFWGVGATAGPIIMSMFMGRSNGWKKGYFAISMIQFGLVIILFLTLSLWKTVEKVQDENEIKEEQEEADGKSSIKIPGVKLALLSFACYCAAESTAGLWGSSYLVNYKGVSVGDAARWISLFYIGITTGRFLSGFFTMKFSNSTLIRGGQVLCIVGAVVLLMPLPTSFSMLGLILFGLGCAPIYPSMIHDTPKRFGKNASQAIIGLQMAFAYMGSTFMPPLFGILVSKISIGVFPCFLLAYVFIMIVSAEKINKLISRKQKAAEKIEMKV